MSEPAGARPADAGHSRRPADAATGAPIKAQTSLVDLQKRHQRLDRRTPAAAGAASTGQSGTPVLFGAGATPPLPLFGDWVGPPPPPSRAVLGAVVAAGVAAALTVPVGRPGLGWFVMALVFAAITATVRLRLATPALPLLLVDAGWAVSAIALASVAAVRDAEWLVTLCLLAAVGAMSISVAGRSFRTVAFAAVAVPVAALRGVPWVVRGLRRTGTRVGRDGLRVAAAALVGLVLVAVFAVLLADADAAFARILDALLPALDGEVPTWVVPAGLVAAAMLGTGFLAAAPPPRPEPRAVPPSRLRPVEWALPVGLLVALFALFAGVQVTTALGGDGYVLATTGLTYAEYARSGFWELLAVTVLAMGVILLGSRWAPPARRWPRGMLAALAGLTLVIVASALSRMWLYQQAYGFTVLRLLVSLCEIWLGIGFLLVVAAVLRPARRWRPVRGMVVTGVVALLAVAWLDPERFVAERNIARYAATGDIDTYYLSTLSADAAPALATLPEPVRSCTLHGITARLGPDGDWRSANAARSAARELPRTVQPAQCP